MNFQLGQALTLGDKKAEYQVDYENYTGNYRCDFRKAGTETFFKISTYHLSDSNKFSAGYTLAFGLRYSYYYGSASYTPAPGYWEDTLFGAGASHFYTRAISWTNGIDFIYRINAKMTLINTLGLKATAVNQGREDRLWGSGGKSYKYTYPSGDIPLVNPILTVQVSPQLLIHFKKISLGIHLNQDVFMINNLINNRSYPQPDLGKVQLSCFTGIGFSITSVNYQSRSKEPVELED